MPGALAEKSSGAAAWARLARPHQWVKNGFVFVGLLFGHAWNDRLLVGQVLMVFAAFCLVSSAVYVFNDIRDREADRRHPRKRQRPVASGAIRPGAAAAVGLVLGAAGLALAAWVSAAAAAILAAYVALNAAYTLGLKHVPILDVFLIAGGFMLRILAGTTGVGIPPSQWLLLCGLMVTVFLGFAKRRAELLALEEGSAGHRPVLDEYSPAALDGMMAISASGVIVTYSLYTVSPDTVRLHGTDQLILTLPFVLYGIFRYVYRLHRRGGGGDPAWDLLHDPHLLAAVLGWLATTFWLLASARA
jgi:4-hydroxybenzoate polyprenyltransferase